MAAQPTEQAYVDSDTNNTTNTYTFIVLINYPQKMLKPPFLESQTYVPSDQVTSLYRKVPFKMDISNRKWGDFPQLC